MKNKTVFLILACILIVSAASVIAYYLYLQNNRYTVINAGDGYAYQVDKRTGESWVILGSDKELHEEVEENETKGKQEKKSPVSNAIEKVKYAKTLDSGYPSFDNDFYIKGKIKDLNGDIKVNGWQGKRVDDQTYLVWYSLVNNDDNKVWVFEYNSVSGIVRYVNNDSALRSKYKSYINESQADN